MFSYTTIPTIKKPDRQILNSEYIRRLIEKHYTFTYNYFQFTSTYSITLFLQHTYSNKITVDMVTDAMAVEPSYTLYSMCGKKGCRYLIRK